MKKKIGLQLSEIAKVLLSFSAGVYLFGDFLTRLVIMQTQAWVTDAMWLPETVLTFGLSAVSFAWSTYSLAKLVKKLCPRGLKHEIT
jgi:uncharacterized membrane protein YfhO